MAQAASEKLKVFISYSRKDAADFVDDLMVGLSDRGFAPFLDRHDIAPGEPWEERLGHLIEQADTVVFVVSPEAVKSERCGWEVDKALSFSKRLLPIIYKPVAETEIPPKLSQLQFIRFDGGGGVMRPLRELTVALQMDLQWVREHTRLGELANRWMIREKPASLLLRGEELEVAKAWKAKEKSDLKVTDEQASFISESEKADAAEKAQQEKSRRNEEEFSKLEQADRFWKSALPAVAIFLSISVEFDIAKFFLVLAVIVGAALQVQVAYTFWRWKFGFVLLIPAVGYLGGAVVLSEPLETNEYMNIDLRVQANAIIVILLVVGVVRGLHTYWYRPAHAWLLTVSAAFALWNALSGFMRFYLLWGYSGKSEAVRISFRQGLVSLPENVGLYDWASVSRDLLVFSVWVLACIWLSHSAHSKKSST